MKNKELIYFLSETHHSTHQPAILVVHLVGPLSKFNEPIFQRCQDQIQQSKAIFLVINFRDVPPAIDPLFFVMLAAVRGFLEARSGMLRFSGVHPELKGLLLNHHIASQAEISDHLVDALKSFSTESVPA